MMAPLPTTYTSEIQSEWKSTFTFTNLSKKKHQNKSSPVKKKMNSCVFCSFVGIATCHIFLLSFRSFQFCDSKNVRKILAGQRVPHISTFAKIQLHPKNEIHKSDIYICLYTDTFVYACHIYSSLYLIYYIYLAAYHEFYLNYWIDKKISKICVYVYIYIYIYSNNPSVPFFFVDTYLMEFFLPKLS